MFYSQDRAKNTDSWHLQKSLWKSIAGTKKMEIIKQIVIKLKL